MNTAHVLEAARYMRMNRILSYYPETGPLRRELYTKHMQFFKAGAHFNDRLAISANRIGKTEGIGAYEVTLHATGRYPDWWEGRRFDRPISVWVAGKTGETTRDILQAKLLGRFDKDPENPGQPIGLGTGMIPADCIIATSPKQGIPNAVDTVWIKHKSGGRSVIGFKSYGKDRDSFEGTEKDLIWLDEEPSIDVFDECEIRLMSTVPGRRNGLSIITFTPLEGYTEVVKRFLESEDPDKFFIQIGWKDAPHLTPEAIAAMSKKFLPHQLKARSEGYPALGEGAIYPIDVEQLLEDDFKIPDHWPRAFAMDVGKTAVVWAALDRDNDVLHFYREYFSETYSPLQHATAIKGIKDQDKWIPGVIDPASFGSSQVDGRKLFKIYSEEYGLNLAPAVNAVEAGIAAVWDRMTTGRLRVFRSMTRWQNEFGRYHRVRKETMLGESAKIVKKSDHLMDASRYMVTSGIARMTTKALAVPSSVPVPVPGRGLIMDFDHGQTWMQ